MKHPKQIKAFSLIELAVVVLLIGLVTIVAVNGKSLLIKANCVASSFGTKTVTDNLDNSSALTSNKNSIYDRCVTKALTGSSGVCNVWQINTTPVAFQSSSITGSATNVFNTSTSITTGNIDVNGWLSQDGLGTLQRIYLDLGGNYTIGGIRIINHHHNTGYTDNGIKNAKIYLTNTPPTTVHNSNVSVDNIIFDGIFPQNSGSNGGGNYSVLTLSKELTGRYLVVDSYDAWRQPAPYDRVGIRRIEYCIW